MNKDYKRNRIVTKNRKKQTHVRNKHTQETNDNMPSANPWTNSLPDGIVMQHTNNFNMIKEDNEAFSIATISKTETLAIAKQLNYDLNEKDLEAYPYAQTKEEMEVGKIVKNNKSTRNKKEKNNEDRYDLPTFMRIMHPYYRPPTKEDVTKALNEFLKDSKQEDGTVSVEEFSKMFMEFGPKYDQEIMDAMLDELDPNKTGKLNLEEVVENWSTPRTGPGVIPASMKKQLVFE